MSGFRERLQELFNSEYGDNQEQSNADVSRSSYLFTKGSDNRKRNDSNNISGYFSKTLSMTQPNKRTSDYVNYRQSASTNGQRRKLSSDVLDNSVITPFYTEKPSFSFELATEPNNSQLIKMRSNSANKYRTRIKKEIDSLSKSFRDSIPHSTKFNRPIAQTNKPEYSGFRINYLTTIAGLKERNKDSRKTKEEYRQKAFSFLFGGNVKKESKFSYAEMNNKRKSGRTLYDILRGKQ